MPLNPARDRHAAHLGRTTQVWDEVVITADATRPLALFRCAQSILWPRADASAV